MHSSAPSPPPADRSVRFTPGRKLGFVFGTEGVERLVVGDEGALVEVKTEAPRWVNGIGREGRSSSERKTTSCLQVENSVPPTLSSARKGGQLQTWWVDGQYQPVPIGLCRPGKSNRRATFPGILTNNLKLD